MSLDKQKLLLSYLVQDRDAFSVCRSILKPEYFDKELRPTVKFLVDHSAKYSSVPNNSMVSAETGIQLFDVSEDADMPNRFKWVCDEVESHCRQAAVVNAVYDASEMISKGELGGIVEPIKAAVLLSLQRDLGMDYFKDPAARLRSMMATSTISTGFKHLDQVLDGGVFKGSLNIAAAPSGGGKSYFLTNLMTNHALGPQKHNVLYVSLELPSEWVAKRMDSMVTGVPSKAVFSKIDEVAFLVKRSKKDSGEVVIIKRPAFTTTANDIAAFMKNYEIQTGVKFDVFIVDYLDIMASVEKVDQSNKNIKDAYVCAELRNLAEETGTVCYSVSQLVKGALSMEELDFDKLAGGKTKVDFADNVWYIHHPNELREQGLLQIWMFKTRTSAGNGRKIILRFDQDTVRYSDMPDDLAFVTSKKKAPSGEQPMPSGTNMDRIKSLRGRVGA